MPLNKSLSSVNKALRMVGVELRQAKTSAGIDLFHDLDKPLRAIYEQVQPYSMTSRERLLTLCDAVQYVTRRNIPGAFVECGVWKGGSSMAAALTFKQLGVERDIHLFDTFEGMPPSTEHDIEISSGRHAEEIRAEYVAESGNFIAIGLDEVRSNMETTGYNMGRVQFHKGMVEDTIPQYAPEQISILRLDTDWYESTLHELKHLWLKLSVGGVLIIDDYGHFQGCKEAVDEFFNEAPLLLFRVDYTGRMAIKTAADRAG